jgi:hypothetical protein
LFVIRVKGFDERSTKRSAKVAESDAKCTRSNVTGKKSSAKITNGKPGSTNGAPLCAQRDSHCDSEAIDVEVKPLSELLAGTTLEELRNFTASWDSGGSRARRQDASYDSPGAVRIELSTGFEILVPGRQVALRA